MTAQGWYQDPFGVHTERWFSDGKPTKLVRDGGAESHDPPPSDEYSGPLVSVESDPGDSSDLLRADEPQPKGDEVDIRLDALIQRSMQSELGL